MRLFLRKERGCPRKQEACFGKAITCGVRKEKGKGKVFRCNLRKEKASFRRHRIQPWRLRPLNSLRLTLPCPRRACRHNSQFYRLLQRLLHRQPLLRVERRRETRHPLWCQLQTRPLGRRLLNHRACLPQTNPPVLRVRFLPCHQALSLQCRRVGSLRPIHRWNRL